MGFGDLASQIIMFVAIITVSITFVFVLNEISQDTQSSLAEKQKIDQSRILTDINFDSIHYSDSKLKIYLKNVGGTKFRPSTIDFYLNGEFINNSLISKEIVLETDDIEKGVFNKNEILYVEINKSLTKGLEHNIFISLNNGYQNSEKFYP